MSYSPAKVTIDLTEYNDLLQMKAQIEASTEITPEDISKALGIILSCFIRPIVTVQTPLATAQLELERNGFELRLWDPVGVERIPKVLLTKIKK